MLEIGSALRAGGEPRAMLGAVASAVRRTTGFGTVVINLYRPAWDDFEVVTVEGSREARDYLLGVTTSWSQWGDLLQERFGHAGAYFVPAGSTDWALDPATFIPDIAPSDDPGAWNAEDALLIPLASSEGELLGIVSIDEPADGRRPDPAALELIGAVCEHAAAALEHAQATAAARRHSAAVEHLLRVSAQVGAGGSPREVLETVAAGIRDALGYTKVVMMLPETPDGSVQPLAAVGWDAAQLARMPDPSLDVVAPLFAPELLKEGCALLELEQAIALLPPELHNI